MSIQSESLDEIHKQRKDYILRDNDDVTKKKDTDWSTLDIDFTLHEFKSALEGSRCSAPGQRPAMLCLNNCQIKPWKLY